LLFRAATAAHYEFTASYLGLLFAAVIMIV
jgi:hypothetical protein